MDTKYAFELLDADFIGLFPDSVLYFVAMVAPEKRKPA